MTRQVRTMTQRPTLMPVSKQPIAFWPLRTMLSMWSYDVRLLMSSAAGLTTGRVTRLISLVNCSCTDSLQSSPANQIRKKTYGISFILHLTFQWSENGYSIS